MLLLAGLCVGERAPASASDRTAVADAARACLDRFAVDDLRPLLRCLDPQVVGSLARRYAKSRLGSASPPEDLVRASGGQGDPAWFAALAPADLLALVARAELLKLTDRGHPVVGARLELLRVRHRIDEVFELRVRLVATFVHGSEQRTVRETRDVLVKWVDGRALIGLPPVLERLLGLADESA